MDTNTQQTETARREVFTYSLNVGGVFGRNRKAKTAYFKLAEVPRTAPLTDAQVIDLALAKLREIKLRGAYTVSEHPEYVETRMMGGVLMESRGFLLTGGRTIIPRTERFGA